MCDDVEEFEEIEQEHEEDYLDYDYVEPVGPKRYSQAVPLPSIEERLRYFKYHQKFNRGIQELLRLVAPYESQGVTKKRMLFLRIEDEYYTFTPKHAEGRSSPIPVECFGHIQYYPSSASPTVTLDVQLYHKHKHKLWDKYRKLSETIKAYERVEPVLIGGLPYYLTHMQANIGTAHGDTIDVQFTAASDYLFGQHTLMRQYEQNHKTRFGKFIHAN